jgi:CIC family chloride channel protein
MRGLATARERLLGNYLRKWVILGLCIGLLAGVGADLLLIAKDWSAHLFLGELVGYQVPLPRGEGVPAVSAMARPWLLPVSLALGGLLSGVIAFRLAPEIAYGGMNHAIEAFHEAGGRMRARVPLLKLVASAITIGSGGSAGREGPAAQIGAGFASWVGDFFHLSPADRRIAVAVGIGAGIGAIFKVPLGGALLGAEVLYMRDFELESLIPGFIASSVAYAMVATLTSWTPLFGGQAGLLFSDPSQLIWYGLLGVATGAAGLLFVWVMHTLREAFDELRLPREIKPALGGLAVGVIALAFPQILSGGYGWIQFAIDGNTATLAVGVMVALVFVKMLATALTIESGASGGDLAPALFIGAMVGGGMWGLLHGNVPAFPAQAAPFVVVGMGAFFGGIAKAPISSILMVAEMTGEFSMIMPAMVAVSIAYVLTGDQTIYGSQVPTRADSSAHRGEYTIPLIQTISVRQAMLADVPTVSPEDPVELPEQLLDERELRAVPVVTGGKLVGIITLSDILRARADRHARVGEVMRADPLVAYPTDSLHTALQRMARSSIGALPVVARQQPDQLLGLLRMTDLAQVLDLQVSELTSRPEGVRSAADDPLRYVPVEEVMSRTFETVPLGAPLESVANRLSESGQHAVLVVDEDGSLAGIVTLTDLERAAAGEDGATPVSQIMTRNVVTARVGQFISEALGQPGAEAARQIAVTNDRDPLHRNVPVGLLRRNDMVLAYLRGRERLASASERSRIRGEGNPDDEVVMTEMPIERLDRANGQTLAELRLPAGAVVTAVERDGSVLVPRGQLRLLAGDRVRILANRDVLDAVLARFHSGAAT